MYTGSYWEFDGLGRRKRYVERCALRGSGARPDIRAPCRTTPERPGSMENVMLAGATPLSASRPSAEPRLVATLNVSFPYPGY